MTYGIGDTSLVEAERLEEELGIEQIYLKLEGENPTGTHKDRLAIHHADDAIIRDFDAITVASCGNYALAMSFVAGKLDLSCKIFMPKKYSGLLVKKIKENGAEVYRVDGGYEESVERSREMAEENGWYDANPGKKNTPISLVAYTDIAEEIQKSLCGTPATLSIAVGNGTTLAGIHLGFRLLWRKNRTEDIPAMLAASSKDNNSIIYTVMRGEREIIDLDPDSLNETEVNEPLLNWKALDGQEAINAIYDTGGAGFGLTDEELLHYQDLLKEKEDVKCLPCSAAALGALDKYLEDEDVHGKHVVVVTSGVKNVRD